MEVWTRRQAGRAEVTLGRMPAPAVRSSLQPCATPASTAALRRSLSCSWVLAGLFHICTGRRKTLLSSSQRKLFADTCADNLNASCYLFTAGSFKPSYCQLLHDAGGRVMFFQSLHLVISCKELILKCSNNRRSEIKLYFMQQDYSHLVFCY